MNLPIKRSVEPEWLDDLPPSDPRAVRSRLDLRRVNHLMGNLGSMVNALINSGATPPGHLVELGGGDGTFLLQLARRMGPRWPGVQAILVDRLTVVADATREAFSEWGWVLETVETDIFDWLPREQSRAVVLANLFLHHFDDAKLALLLKLAADRSEVFVACEPRRSFLALGASHGLALVGCNEVTRHDAVASVRAGFADQELRGCWPGTGRWKLKEYSAGLFTHCFVAARQGDGNG